MEQLIITGNVRNCTYTIYAVMLAATLVAHAAELFKKDMANFKLRLKSFWLVLALFTMAFAVSGKFALVFLAFINYLALKEFFSLIPARRADRRVLLWAYLAIPIQFYFIYINWIVMFYLFIPLYMFLLIPVRMVLIGENEGFLKSCGTIHWGLMATVYSLGYLAMYLLVPLESNPSGGAVGMLLCLLVLTVFNDFSQFFFGKLLGKKRIIPKVSPNKTWEGFIGGVVATAALASVLTPYLTPLSHAQGVLAGLGIGVTGFLGDVTMSAIKRDIGVKDTAHFCPGTAGYWTGSTALCSRRPCFSTSPFTFTPCWANKMKSILKYLFFLLCVKPFIHVVFGINVKNPQNLPRNGPAILVANHNSHIDTLVLMCLFTTPQLLKVNPVAAMDYFFNTGFRSFLFKTLLGAIAIKRHKRMFSREDIFAEINQNLKEGHTLIIYPEGTRSMDSEIQEFKTGVAHLAKSNPEVPVVPIFINGPDRIMPKYDSLPVPFICDVHIGAPMHIEGDTKRQFTERVYREVLKLKQTHYEGRNS